MPLSYCEIEFKIGWLKDDRYKLDARFMNPLSDTENELVDQTEITIDLAQLRDQILDINTYGKMLSDMLFGAANSPVRAAYSHARTAASQQDGLRIRLNIQGSAPELNAIRWETLLDPDDDTCLFIQERLWFARFLSSRDFRWKPPLNSSDMRALVVIANPHDSKSKWNLAEVDALSEFDIINKAVHTGGKNSARQIKLDVLSKPATVFNIASALKEEYADILYIICHGMLTPDSKPRLLLETPDNLSHLIEGRELVERLRDMHERPRLIVLASCASAGAEHADALTAIGPGLSAAGVPAVIAMQGNITQETSSLFMSTMFENLACTGQIDSAVAAARSAIRQRPDWWMPVLFMRLKTGRLWPAFASPSIAFDKWDAVVSDIQLSTCVPILGPGLVESAWGGMRNMAGKWAKRYEFPLAPWDRDNLAQVAQYIVYRQSRSRVLTELTGYLIDYFRNHFPGDRDAVEAIQEPAPPLDKGASRLLNQWLEHVGRLQRSQNKQDPHRLLARLPIPVFINANRDNFLLDALVDAGKRPQVCLCTWLVNYDMPVHLGPKLPENYIPSPEEPLIFHVFGNFKHPRSLVLTEDDYFDFLMAVTRNEHSRQASIPGMVTEALASSGLLLLGFQPDDWDFRVLLKGVLKQPGSQMSNDYTRVAVQMSPTEGSIIDPDRATHYLQTYFQSQGKLTTFWGAAQDFLNDLAQHCEEQGVIPFEE